MKITPVQIDWLSFSGNGTITDLCGLTCKIEPYSTRQFSKVFTLYWHSYEFGILTTTPQSSILPKHMFILKINNRFLYSDIYYKIINQIFSSNKIERVKISRLDICIDFNTFMHNYNPENLIKNFVNERIIKKGKSKYQINGDNHNTICFDYLRFNSKSSNVQVYLYNKSKEMCEVKHKQWIADFHTMHNLNISSDVWRLEFSLKNINYSIVSQLTGDILNIDINFINLNQNLYNLFWLLVDKYFTFYKCGNQANKSRLNTLALFDNENIEYKKMKLSESIESNRLDKYFLKRLDNLFQELRTGDSELFHDISNIVSIFHNKKNLSPYYYQKIKPISDSNNCKPYVYRPFVHIPPVDDCPFDI